MYGQAPVVGKELYTSQILLNGVLKLDDNQQKSLAHQIFLALVVEEVALSNRFRLKHLLDELLTLDYLYLFFDHRL